MAIDIFSGEQKRTIGSEGALEGSESLPCWGEIVGHAVVMWHTRSEAVPNIDTDGKRPKLILGAS